MAAVIFIVGFVCEIISYQYTHFSIEEQNKEITGYIPVENAEYIYTDGYYESKEASKLIATFISKLPSCITKKFTSNWKVVLAKNRLEDYSNTASGVTLWSKKVILLNAYKDIQITYNVFIHELGHWFDLSYGYLSESNTFYTIYESYKGIFTEVDQLVSKDYTSSSAQEFFASAFKEFYLNSSHLLSTAPEAYTYIENAINTASNSEHSNLKYNIIGFFRNVLKTRNKS